MIGDQSPQAKDVLNLFAIEKGHPPHDLVRNLFPTKRLFENTTLRI